MSCRKVGSGESDLTTVAGASKLDNIRTVFGAAVTRELLEVGSESPEYEVRFCGLVSNPNFNMKKMTFVLFINSED